MILKHNTQQNFVEDILPTSLKTTYARDPRVPQEKVVSTNLRYYSTSGDIDAHFSAVRFTGGISGSATKRRLFSQANIQLYLKKLADILYGNDIVSMISLIVQLRLERRICMCYLK